MRATRVQMTLSILLAAVCCAGQVEAQETLVFDGYYPQWMARVSVPYLLRNNPDSLQYFQAPGGGDALNFDQFDFDQEPGLDVSLFREVGEGQRIEGRYLGLWNVNAGQSVQLGPGIGAINTTPPFPFVLDPVATLIQGTYDSEFHSGEFNYCLDESPGQTWIFGFRYLNVGEEFHANYQALSLLLEADSNIDVNNNLYGLQIGAEADLLSDWMGNCRLVGNIKAGVYGVQSDYDYDYTDPGIPLIQGSDSESDVAFVGELGLTLNKSLGYNTSLLIGYRLLWIDGVALASEQIDNTDNAIVNPVNVTVDNSGDLFYHGATLGVEYRF